MQRSSLEKNAPAHPVFRGHAGCRHSGVSFLGEQLNGFGVTPADQLLTGEPDRSGKVAGLVLLRQRPSTAKGIAFVTLEDETGHVNLIVYQNIWDRYRSAALGATLMLASGQLQRHQGVIHILVQRLEVGSQLLRDVPVRSRDFQ